MSVVSEQSRAAPAARCGGHQERGRHRIAGDEAGHLAAVGSDQPEGVRTGFKLFYEEDTEGSRLMTPEEVLALWPRPDYVMFE